MNHALRMILGCTIPLLLIFVLPLIGVGEGAALFIAVILMFACHLLMIGGHGRGHGGNLEHQGKGGRHEHTQR